jgi:hypothetical protein
MRVLTPQTETLSSNGHEPGAEARLPLRDETKGKAPDTLPLKR